MDKENHIAKTSSKASPWDDFFNSKDQVTPDFMTNRIDPPAQERDDQCKFEMVKAELKLAFAAPKKSYIPLTADDIFKRNDHLRQSDEE